MIDELAAKILDTLAEIVPADAEVGVGREVLETALAQYNATAENLEEETDSESETSE